MWFVALPAVVGAVAWRYHFVVVVLICASWLGVVLVGLMLSRFAARRVRRIAAQRAGESTCTFARSFDFRRVDTRVIRAVYEEIQSEVEFPIRAGDHLVRDLQLDDEDLALDIIPSIARRLGRSLTRTRRTRITSRATRLPAWSIFWRRSPLNTPKRPNQAMQLTASKPDVHAWSVCRR